MKNMDREDFWIIVVTLLNVGIHFGVWFFKGSLVKTNIGIIKTFALEAS